MTWSSSRSRCTYLFRAYVLLYFQLLRTFIGFPSCHLSVSTSTLSHHPSSINLESDLYLYPHARSYIDPYFDVFCPYADAKTHKCPHTDIISRKTYIYIYDHTLKYMCRHKQIFINTKMDIHIIWSSSKTYLYFTVSIFIFILIFISIFIFIFPLSFSSLSLSVSVSSVSLTRTSSSSM